MERQGSGLSKIMEFYQSTRNYDSSRAPKLYSDRTLFRATFWNLNYGKSVDELLGGQTEGHVTQVGTQAGTQETDQASNDATFTYPRSGAQAGTQENLASKIRALIKSDAHITRKAMAEQLGCSPRSIARALSEMPDVRYIGHGYSGHWAIDQ